MQLKCTTCKQTKDEDQFHKDSTKSRRNNKAESCKTCAIKRSKEYYNRVKHTDKIKIQRKKSKRNFRRWYFLFKSTLSCQNCGYNKCPAAIEFHHRKGEVRNFYVSAGINYSGKNKVLEEIKKCDILCSRCHLEQHPYKKDGRNKKTKNKIDKISKLKLEKGCELCGYKKFAKSLGFHHIDNNKEHTISQMLLRDISWELIELEISKCIIVCANCHKEIHYKEDNWYKITKE